jgi:hypothetical protein
MLLTLRKSKIAQSPELPITYGEHRYGCTTKFPFTPISPEGDFQKSLFFGSLVCLDNSKIKLKN